MRPSITLEVLGQVAFQGHEAAVAIALGIHRRGFELLGKCQIIGHSVIQSTGILAEAEHALGSLSSPIDMCFHRLPVLDGHKSALLPGDYVDIVNTALKN